MGRSAHLEDGVHLDRDAARQRVHADGGARMASGIAEDLDHDIGGAIGDLRLLREVVGAMDEGTEPDAARDPVKIAIQGSFRMRKNVEGAELRRFLSVLEGNLAAELADKSQLAVPLTDLSGDEKEIAAAHEGHVVRDRRRSEERRVGK